MIRVLGRDSSVAMLDIDTNVNSKIDIEEWMQYFNRHCEVVGVHMTQQIVDACEKRSGFHNTHAALNYQHYRR